MLQNPLHKAGFGLLAVTSDRAAPRPWTPGRMIGGPRRPGHFFGDVVDAGASYATGVEEKSVEQQAGEVLGAYMSTQDVRRMLAKKQVDLKYLQDMRKTVKLPPASTALDWQIARLQADIAALKQRLALATEGEEAQRSWRSIGQTAGVVGVVLGVALTASVLAGIARKAVR